VPKELLEAKKMELIQEKVCAPCSGLDLELTRIRLMQRRQQRKNGSAKSERRHEIWRLRDYASANEQNVAAVEEEVVEVAETTNEDFPDLPVEIIPQPETIADLPQDEIWTHTFLLDAVTGARMTAVDEGQDQYPAPLLAIPLHQQHPLVGDAIAMLVRLVHDAGHLVPLVHYLDEITEGEGGVLQVVVKIDHDPIHV